MIGRGSLVIKPSEPELGVGVVAGTYSEDEVLVGWVNLEGLTYEYAADLAVKDGGSDDNQLVGGSADQR